MRRKYTGNYFRSILSTHTVNSARHMLKKESFCFVCITAHTIVAPIAPIPTCGSHAPIVLVCLADWCSLLPPRGAPTTASRKGSGWHPEKYQNILRYLI